MKAQCDNHGCSELLCGCPVQCLEDDKRFSEIIRAKDRYIARILKDNAELRTRLELEEDNLEYDEEE